MYSTLEEVSMLNRRSLFRSNTKKVNPFGTEDKAVLYKDYLIVWEWQKVQ
jgi:hypothetical protein